METNIIINIGIYKMLGLIGTLVLGTWYASHRLTKVETEVTSFDKRLTNMEGRFDKRLTNMEGRIDKSFSSASPVALLERGLKILNSSGLKKYIDANKAVLLEQFKSKCAMDNQYDIQEQAFKFFDNLDSKDLESSLKKAAFDYGVSIETVKRIGGIYFRDIALEQANFKPEDLDKPKIL